MSLFCKEYKYKCGGVVKTHKYSGRIKRFIDLAAKVAQQSDSPDYRHGAVLARGSNAVNVSFNKNSFCSFGQRFRDPNQGNPTLHAELGVILGMERKITEGATVYVARVGKNGDYRLSKPCHMCYAAMKHVGIKRVVYTINNQVAGSYKL